MIDLVKGTQGVVSEVNLCVFPSTSSFRAGTISPPPYLQEAFVGFDYTVKVSPSTEPRTLAAKLQLTSTNDFMFR